MQIAFSHFPGVYPSQVIQPYEVETDGDVEYTRYTDGMHCTDPYRKTIKEEKIFIFKKSKVGNIVRNEKAWDLWANRKTATYVPINSQMGEFSSRGMGSYA